MRNKSHLIIVTIALTIAFGLVLLKNVKADGDILFQIGSNAVKQTVSDADMQRVVDHALKAYDDPLNPISQDEAVQRMLNDVITSIFGNIVSGEKAIAAKTAAEAVAPIEVKPPK